MASQILTPQEVESKLSIVTADFKKVLDVAKAKNKKVVYYYKSTPFGVYPLAVEIVK